MTEPGQTDDYSVTDHINAIIEHCGTGIIDYCIYDTGEIVPEFIKKYKDRHSRAIKCLEEGLDESLSFYAFPSVEAKKISSTNMLERLNREIRRRTSVISIFPNEKSYTRLVTMHLIEYSKDWSITCVEYLSPQTIRPLLN